MKTSFPWTSNTWNQWLQNFDGTNPISVDWHWEPFHREGIRAFRYCLQKNITENEIDETLFSLSCPAVARSLIKKINAPPGIIADDGRILPFDPETKIRRSLRAFTFPW